MKLFCFHYLEKQGFPRGNDSLQRDACPYIYIHMLPRNILHVVIHTCFQETSNARILAANFGTSRSSPQACDRVLRHRRWISTECGALNYVHGKPASLASRIRRASMFFVGTMLVHKAGQPPLAVFKVYIRTYRIVSY